jgi:hypothetical protein
MVSARLSAVFDNRVIDGAVDGFAAAIRNVGGRLRGAQRGLLQENLTVAFAVGAGLVLFFVWFF